MPTTMMVLAAINIAIGPMTDLLRQNQLYCRSSELAIENVVAIRVSCNEEVGSQIAISYAFSYLKAIGKSEYSTVNGIVAGDGTDEELDYSKEWAIGFDKPYAKKPD